MKQYSPYSVSQAMKKSLPVMGLIENPATPHDLRRTMASRLGELGISRVVIGKLLNHSESGVTARVYDKYEYAAEKAAAMAAWSERVTEIVSGQPAPSNVVRLNEAPAAE